MTGPFKPHRVRFCCSNSSLTYRIILYNKTKFHYNGPNSYKNLTPIDVNFGPKTLLNYLYSYGYRSIKNKVICAFKSVRVRFDCICLILLEKNFYHVQAMYYPYIILDALEIEKKALEKKREQRFAN